MRKYALLVGVERYEDPTISALQFAKADATALGERLQRRCQFDQVHVLTEGPGYRSPRLSNIITTLKDICGEIHQEDIFLLFFAGHGVEKDNRGYLLVPESLHAFPEYASLSLELLRKTLERLVVRRRIMLFDACRNCPETTRSRADNLMGNSIARDIVAAIQSQPAAGATTILLAACQAGQRAYEWPAKGHGVFTHFLLEGLDGAAWSNDGLEFKRLAAYVTREVHSWALKTPGLHSLQEPWYEECGNPEPIILAQRKRSMVPLQEPVGIVEATKSPPPIAAQGPESLSSITDIPIARGAAQLLRCLGLMLGPRGRSVAVPNEAGMSVVQEGAIVLERIRLEDEQENAAVALIKSGSLATRRVCGDGATMTAILAAKIFLGCAPHIAAGASPAGFQRVIDKAVDLAVREIGRIAKPATTSAEILRVSSAACQNAFIAKAVVEAIEKIGKDGPIVIEEGREIETVVNVVEGMQFDQGYLSPYFITDYGERTAVLDRPYILAYDGRIDSVKAVVPLLEKVAKQGRAVLVIAGDLNGEVLATLVVNKLKNVIKIAAVKAPGFGARRKMLLEDIAVLTGAECITANIEQVELAQLGRAVQVIVKSDATTIVEGAGSVEAIKSRIARIMAEIDSSKSEYDIEKLQERLTKLAGGVAVISVGAITETDMRENLRRAKAALAAAESAVEEGIVPGGGVTLLRAQAALKHLQHTDQERPAVETVKEALVQPLCAIVENAGLDVATVLENICGKGLSFGYDVVAEEYGDLYEAGVIDSAKMVRTALHNAAAAASLLIDQHVIGSDVLFAEPSELNKKRTQETPGESTK